MTREGGPDTVTSVPKLFPLGPQLSFENEASNLQRVKRQEQSVSAEFIAPSSIKQRVM